MEEGRGRRVLDLEQRRTSVAGWRSGGEERTRSVQREGPGRRFFFRPHTLGDLLYRTRVESFRNLFNGTDGVVYICNSDYQPC
jgi:hypothetical protein